MPGVVVVLLLVIRPLRADLAAAYSDTTGMPAARSTPTRLRESPFEPYFGLFNRLARLQTDSRPTVIEPGTGIPLRVANTGPTTIVKPTHDEGATSPHRVGATLFNPCFRSVQPTRRPRTTMSRQGTGHCLRGRLRRAKTTKSAHATSTERPVRCVSVAAWHSSHKSILGQELRRRSANWRTMPLGSAGRRLRHVLVSR
jgi:hypothetical protein